MLLVLVQWLMVSAISWTLGTWGLGMQRYTAPVRMWAGLFGLMVPVSIAAFWPVKAWDLVFQLCCAFGCLLLWWRLPHLRQAWQEDLRQFRHSSRFEKISFTCLALGGLWLSCLGPMVYDDGLYYTPFIQWLEQHGTVPGLANLHTRLGFNSNWHVLSAALARPLGLSAVYKLNGLLFVWLLWHSLLSAVQWRQGDRRPLVFLQVASPAALGLYARWCTSPAADWVVIGTTLLIAGLFLDLRKRPRERQSLLLVTWLAAGIVTIKVSAVPVLLFPLILAWTDHQGGFRTVGLGDLAVMCVAGLCMGLPWMLRTWLLTGWLLFPVPLSVGQPDWQVPAQVVRQTACIIETWAKTQRTHCDPEGHSVLGHWLPVWWQIQDPLEKTVIAGSLLLIIAWIAAWLRTRDRSDEGLLFLAVLHVGLLFWWVKAPDPRFGYGFWVPIALYLSGWLRLRLPDGLASGLSPFALRVAVLPFMAWATLVACQSQPPQWQQVWMPAPASQVELRRLRGPDGSTFYAPAKGDQYWGTQLDCTPEHERLPRRRGRTPAEGFRPNGQQMP